ncbi:MAG: 50S ribosomal protein L3 [Euryarchaeota archaeon]|nr:50S ribosomal protein L3 [Euryarchaeota archaeon]MBT4407375.1 50S ribosomal protein L3 [Euryarchaeota archaeon]MBT6644704.1 50S ribosomal protein L3 [Euryarchaeota archaeon]
MGKRNHPRRGSMAFSPRKRASRHFGRVKSWPEGEGSEVRIQGFAGWKAGMTHVLAKDTNPKSKSAGQEVRIPVTVIEVPSMYILGVRGYRSTAYGLQTAGEAWIQSEVLAESFPQLGRRMPMRKNHDADAHFEALETEDLVSVRLIAATMPSKVSATPSKTPEVMEIGLSGGDTAQQLNWAREQIGQEFNFTDAFSEGTYTDVVAVTKGYGWQGVIRRFGGKLLSHKNSKKRRQHGNMGAFGDGYVRKSIRQGGQTGYHQRTEFNKQVMRISNPEDNEITPDGGFLHYGEVNNNYILMRGSIPGPAKRLIRFRDAVRAQGKEEYPIDITYVSTSSKQGV